MLDEAVAGEVDGQSTATTSDPLHLLPQSLWSSAWDEIVVAATQQWQDVIEQRNLEGGPANVRFEAVDLPGAMLALATPQTDGSFQISLDLDAAGFDWYVDPTPLDNSEFEQVVPGLQMRMPDANPRRDRSICLPSWRTSWGMFWACQIWMNVSIRSAC